MKKFNRFLSMFLAVHLLFGLFSINVSAKTKVKKPSSGNYYLIQHVGSGKYLDITDESTQNGAHLQIWEKYPKHQNHILITPHLSNY